MDSKVPDLYIAAQNYADAMYDCDRGADSRMGAQARKDYDTAIAAHVAAVVAAREGEILAQLDVMHSNLGSYAAWGRAGAGFLMSDVRALFTTTPTVEANRG